VKFKAAIQSGLQQEGEFEFGPLKIYNGEFLGNNLIVKSTWLTSDGTI
jgi:hypothetical protein